MTQHYSQYPRHYVAVDCIIFGIDKGRLCILLTKRNFEPEKGKWSLMGGFVGDGESVDAAAYRVLTALTGLENIYMEQVGTFGEVDRDRGERVISVAYGALINIDDRVLECTVAHNGNWTPLDELPQLVFDHPQMIAKARGMVKLKFSTEPIAFNLLPEYFTLSQLQSLYETVFDEAIDKRNFRKRINELPCIVSTDMIDKRSSRRGARLYTYDAHAYADNPKFKL